MINQSSKEIVPLAVFAGIYALVIIGLAVFFLKAYTLYDLFTFWYASTIFFMLPGYVVTRRLHLDSIEKVILAAPISLAINFSWMYPAHLYIGFLISPLFTFCGILIVSASIEFIWRIISKKRETKKKS